MTEERQPTFFEIGYGNLTWKPIIAAADAVGCEWYIVEQDRCAGSVRVAQDELRVFPRPLLPVSASRMAKSARRLAGVLLVLVSIAAPAPATAGNRPQRSPRAMANVLQLHPDNPHYFLYRGRPTLWSPPASTTEPC